MFNFLSRRALLIAIIPLSIALAICNVQKYVCLYNYSLLGNNLIDSIYEETSNKNVSSACVFVLNAYNENTYGIYSGTPQSSSGYGVGLKSKYGWKSDIVLYQYHNGDNKTPIFDGSVFIDMNENDFITFIKNKAKDTVVENGFDIAWILLSDGTFYTIDNNA